MENGNEVKLVEQFSGMALKDVVDSNESLFQVMKAVEAAETTIKQQMEENKRLRRELLIQTRNLRSYANQDKDHIDAIDYSPVFNNVPTFRADKHSTANISGKQSIDSLSNGVLKVLSRQHVLLDAASPSQLSSPSTSFSPTNERDDVMVKLVGRGLVQTTGANDSSWNQDMPTDKVHEKEIVQLKKFLAEFSLKEARILSEKNALEKRISSMRLAFDKQQQDLVDASSKALSYRQDIIEENVRLTYELQAARNERSTFMSSLLSLLSDYAFLPPVSDAQSIVCNVRVLFRHLQETLNHTEKKLKEFEYQLVPWYHEDEANLDRVPQSTYFPGNGPTNLPYSSDLHFQNGRQSGFADKMSKDLESDLKRYPPLGSRVNTVQSGNLRQTVVEASREHTVAKDLDTLKAEINGGLEMHPYSVSTNDPVSSYFPYLPPVLEEHSSSFSEAAADDPLPGITDLQISGDAFPGQVLQACGYSIHGTTNCNFEWVRHLDDGSVNYIEGAKQPTYLVTADDVQSFLAIEVHPLDDRNRKGKLVKVFANDHRKIICDPDMQMSIEKTLHNGHASYNVSLSIGFLDIWEPATLSMKRNRYNIKCGGSRGVVVADKFLPSSSISIPYDQPTEFIIRTTNGSTHLLRVDNFTDNSHSRDLIVLTFRLFMARANSIKTKKRNLFFK